MYVAFCNLVQMIIIQRMHNCVCVQVQDSQQEKQVLNLSAAEKNHTRTVPSKPLQISQDLAEPAALPLLSKLTNNLFEVMLVERIQVWGNFPIFSFTFI